MLFRRQLMLVKPETVVGTDSVPTAALNSILVRDVSITFDQQQLDRPVYLPDISNTAVRPGRTTATLTFTAELKGSGVAGTAPKLGTLLRGCGFAETALAAGAGYDYDPISSNPESLTFYVYIDGLLHKVLGARGSFNIVGAAGEYGLVNFTFQGSYVEPTDTPLPGGVVYEDSLPPIIEEVGLDILDLVSCAQQFTIDVANTLNPRMCVNASEGVQGYSLTARNVTGSFNPEAVTMATNNPFAKLKAGDVGDFEATIGSEVNNIVEITGNVQYTNVSPGDRDGTLIWDIPLRFVRETGNDEIKFSFPQVP